MNKIGIFFAEGSEEIEGLTVVDLLRRAKMEIITISITGKKEVTGSHGITFITDALAEEVDFDSLAGIVLPGGIPGTPNLGASAIVQKVIKDFAQKDKLVSAICAAPSVLGEAGLLEGKKATCYPGFEDKLLGAEWVKEEVVVDKNIITSRGLGTAIEFALSIITYFADENTADDLAKKIIYRM